MTKDKEKKNEVNKEQGKTSNENERSKQVITKEMEKKIIKKTETIANQTDNKGINIEAEQEMSSRKQSKIQKLRSTLRRKAQLKARNVITFVLFLGVLIANSMRCLIPIGLPAMVNQTTFAVDEETYVPGICEVIVRNQTKMTQRTGPFAWSQTQQLAIIHSFYYGYLFSQIPSAFLARYYKAKSLLGTGMLINMILGFIIPVVSNYGFHFIVAIRILQGVGEGALIPCCHTILANWTPPNERSRRVTMVYSGDQLGTAIMFSLSDYLLDSPTLGGWPTLFYIVNGLSGIWLVAFFILVFDDPMDHPRISLKEKITVIYAIWKFHKRKVNIPWREIFSSFPFLAIVCAHVAFGFGYGTLTIELPMFMHELVHFRSQQIGIPVTIPHIAMSAVAIMSGITFDMLITKFKLSTTIARKVGNGIGQFGPAIALLVATFVGCNQVSLLITLSVGLGLSGAAYSGFLVNHIDISPNFAGILIALSNFCSIFAGFIVPILSGFVISTKASMRAWKEIFYFSSALYIVCNIFYLICASGKKQTWDEDFTRERSTSIRSSVFSARSSNQSEKKHTN